MAMRYVPSGSRTGLIDLASKRLGGMVLVSNDEFFGAKENLLNPAPPRYDPDAYYDRGKVMDGWETRRKRVPGEDWCVIRLGVTGMVDALLVDTSFFKGNYPEACSLQGTVCASDAAIGEAEWFPLLGRTELRGDAVQRFDIETSQRATHVRFTIHPDGGVARVRMLGRPLVDLHAQADPGGRLDLAATINGGRAVACSDAFFSAPSNLITVGDAQDMSDGWETRRRRGPGEDWAILELATTGTIERIELDTTHFKGNYPDRCRIEALHVPGIPAEKLPADGWDVLVPETPLRPHARHQFDLVDAPPATHLRVVSIPDGGIARLRAYGHVTDEGWARATVALLDAMPDDAVAEHLRPLCGSEAWVDGMVARRPYGDPEVMAGLADEVWAGLDAEDHLEAFAAHPRIGDRSGPAHTRAEQAGTATADDATLAALADGNVAYEERFGFVFLIRAAGRSAAEMLSALEGRLTNDRETEISIAAEQQGQITSLRLAALLRDGLPR